MKFFLESQDVDLWDIIEICPYKPTKRNQVEVVIDKPKAEWTQDEKTKLLLNSRAKFFLKCALSISKFDKIEECGTTQEIQNTLQTTHEDTNHVKDSKINILTHKFEMFKMQ